MKLYFLLLIFTSSFSFYAQEISTSQPMIVVIGEGIVKVVPDQVVIKSRIEHEGEDAQSVKRQNDVAVDRIIKYLKGRGISEGNIRTDYVNLNKNYDYNNKSYHYVASQTISIKLEDLNEYEEIMSGLLEAGLNRIEGVNFMSSQIEMYRTEARKLAVEDARKKAGEYAGALGQNAGKAISISEIENQQIPPVLRMNEMMKSNADTVEQETLAPGQMQVAAKVTVGFSLE